MRRHAKFRLELPAINNKVDPECGTAWYRLVLDAWMAMLSRTFDIYRDFPSLSEYTEMLLRIIHVELVCINRDVYDGVDWLLRQRPECLTFVKTERAQVNHEVCRGADGAGCADDSAPRRRRFDGNH